MLSYIGHIYWGNLSPISASGLFSQRLCGYYKQLTNVIDLSFASRWSKFLVNEGFLRRVQQLIIHGTTWSLNAVIERKGRPVRR